MLETFMKTENADLVDNETLKVTDVNQPALLGDINQESEKLQIAAKEGDIKTIKEMLTKNESTNTYRESLAVALYNAVYYKNKEIIRVLLDHGADPNGGYNNISLLCTAVEDGEIEILKILLKYGADPDKISNYSGYALIKAAKKGDLAIVELLLKHGADVNILNNKESALMNAGANGHINVVQLLLDRGAYPYIETASGESLLTKIANNGKVNVAKLLLKRGININLHREFTGYIPLILAAKEGHAEFVELLLASGENSDVKDSFGDSALICATVGGHITVVKQLIKYGADENIKDKNNLTSLQYAEQNGYSEIVQLLSENMDSLNNIEEIIMAPIKKFLN